MFVYSDTVLDQLTEVYRFLL